MGGLSPIARDAARLLAGLVLTLACYLAVHGHLAPGGGAAGGLVAAAAFVLLILACGADEGSAAAEDAGRTFGPLGVLLLVMVAGLGLETGVFFRNFGFPGTVPGERSLLGGGTALLAELALGLAVWMSAAAGFLALAAFRRTRGGGGAR